MVAVAVLVVEAEVLEFELLLELVEVVVAVELAVEDDTPDDAVVVLLEVDAVEEEPPEFEDELLELLDARPVVFPPRTSTRYLSSGNTAPDKSTRAVVGSINSTAAGTISTSLPSLNVPSPPERVTRMVPVLIVLARIGSLKVTINSAGGVLGVLLGPGVTATIRGPVESLSRLPTPEEVEDGSCSGSDLKLRPTCTEAGVFGAAKTNKLTVSTTPPKTTSNSTRLKPEDGLRIT